MTNLPIQQIDPVAVKMWVFNLKKTNITGRTLASYQRIVKTFFRWCSDNGYLEKNPCRSVAMVKYEMRRRHALSRDELTSIRYACADLRERTMVELLYSTGCRVSELVSIRKQDIDMDKGIVYAKNWKSRREKIVYISDVCKFYLNKYLPTVSDNGDFLFYNKNRSSGAYTPIKVRGVERMVSSIGSRASLPKGRVHPHIFRHTLATDIVGGGGSLADAQRVLDHSKIETTLIYAEMSNSHIQEVHKRCIS